MKYLKSLILLGSVALASCAPKSETETGAAVSFENIVDAQGNMHVPGDYLEKYKYLGTFSVAADKGPGAAQLHIVYASPGAAAAHKKDGKFPDGTVLVKEVYEAETGQKTTGTVSYAKKLAGWFIMVKDSKNSHPDNKLWGDGWGWAWFDAATPNKTSSTDYTVDCQACHMPAQENDWVYLEAYPELAK